MVSCIRGRKNKTRETECGEQEEAWLRGAAEKDKSGAWPARETILHLILGTTQVIKRF